MREQYKDFLMDEICKIHKRFEELYRYRLRDNISDDKLQYTKGRLDEAEYISKVLKAGIY